MRFRKAAGLLHIYLGLAAGLLLSLLGLTGSLLVFGEALDARLNPSLLEVRAGTERVPLEDIAASVTRMLPQSRPTHARLPQGDGAPLEFWMGGAEGRRVFADPYTGRILGVREPKSSWLGFVRRLHVDLLAGERGERIVGFLGIFLLILGVTGLVLWWPKRRGLTKAPLIVRNRGSLRFHLSLHRLMGLAATPLLAVIAFSGAALALHGPFQGAITFLTGIPFSNPPPRLELREGLRPLPLDSLVRKADLALPGALNTFLYFPPSPTGAFRVRKRFPGEDHPNGRSFVHLDPYTGAILQVQDSRTAPLPVRFYNYLYPAHIGRWGGIPGRTLHVLAGMVLPLLFVTGFLAWRRRECAGRGATQVPCQTYSEGGRVKEHI